MIPQDLLLLACLTTVTMDSRVADLWIIYRPAPYTTQPCLTLLEVNVWISELSRELHAVPTNDETTLHT